MQTCLMPLGIAHLALLPGSVKRQATLGECLRGLGVDVKLRMMRGNNHSACWRDCWPMV